MSEYRLFWAGSRQAPDRDITGEPGRQAPDYCDKSTQRPSADATRLAETHFNSVRVLTRPGSLRKNSKHLPEDCVVNFRKWFHSSAGRPKSMEPSAEAKAAPRVQRNLHERGFAPRTA